MLLLEVRWCVECEADTGLERPGGADGSEGACVDCGAAVWLWADRSEPLSEAFLDELAELVAATQPVAIKATPTSASATPAA